MAREGAAEGPQTRPSGYIPVGLLIGGLLGALLLVTAEFTTLFQVHVAGANTPIKSVTAGSHHTYAMAVIGGFAAALAVAVWRAGSWPALVALAILGLTGLLIALLGDLPDARSTGVILTSSHFVTARSTPSAGFYLETLGAIVLLVTSAWGLLLLEPPRSARSAL